jgi:hypothetical protein
MKKLYIVCVLTVAVIILDIVLLHSGSAHAQQPGLRIDRVMFQGDIKTVTLPQVGGRIVGFSCSHFGEGPMGECFVATSPN